MRQSEPNEYFPFLTNEMVEEQARTDFLKYQRATGRELTFPIYPDEILQGLWGVTVEYLDEVFSSDNEEVLACFIPEKQVVYLNNSMRGLEGRVSFSLAHEAGHVSLHSFLAKVGYKEALCRGKLSVGDKEKMIERQADRYASALLMPKNVLLVKLGQLEHTPTGVFDLTIYGKKLSDFFGVSHQALERRLADLGISSIGGYYGVKTKKVSEKFFEDMEAERTTWSAHKKGRV
ncbi:MAG: ImmA/IrrE family metallo-endopeptidase [Patescibacteria group bacterium]